MAAAPTVDIVARTVRRTVIACLGGAAALLIAGVALGHAAAGLALAVGLALGSINALLVRRSASLGVAFGALSLGRLVVLTGLAVLAGAVLGLREAWMVVLGMALAQLILVGMAARQALAR